MSGITHTDYMSLVERIEKLENDLRWITGDILVKESQEMGFYEGININPPPKGSGRPRVPPAAPPKPNRCTCCGGCNK